MPWFLGVTYAILWLIVAVQFIAIFALYHHFGEMYLSSREGREEQGPELGQTAAHLQESDLDGRLASLDYGSAPKLLVFMSTTCTPCTRLLPVIERLSRRRAEIEVFVICAGEAAAVADWASSLRPACRVVADPGRKIALRYGLAVTPYLVGLDAHNVVQAKGVIAGERWLDSVVDVLGGSERRSGRIVTVGDGAQ